MSIQRAVFLVNLVLISLGAYFSAGLFYQIWGLQIQSETIAPLSEAQATTNTNISVKPYSAFRAIQDRDLFKTQKTAETPKKDSKLDLDNMEETKLQLKLWGTVTGDSESSYAVIEDTQKREQNLYRVGDNIQNATVKAILRAKVVLSVNDQDEILAMEEINQSSSSSRYAFGASRQSSSIYGSVPIPRRTQRVSLRRSMIDDSMQDVSKLMTEINIQPSEEGLSLSNIKPNSIFRRMGLRNGDVLKTVDGQEIRSVDDALKLYENLRSSDKVSLILQRRGSDRTIDYNIR